MMRTLTSVAALLLGVAILLAGQGMQATLLPVRATLESFSTLSIGLMGGAYFLGFTVGCLRGVRLVQQVGHIRVFAAMSAIASAAPLLHALWLDDWVWWLLRLASGYCFAVLYVVIESWLNELSTNDNRGTVFSAYVFISMTVMAVGQQILLLSDPSGMVLFALASMLVSVAAVPVVLSRAVTPQPPEVATLDLRRLWRVSHTGLLGCLVSGLANGAFWSLAPVFANDISTDLKVVAGFMTGAIIGGAAGQWPLGIWSDRVDRRIVLGAVSLVSAAAGISLWWLSGDLPPSGLIGFSALWGAVSFPLYSVAVAHTNDYADPGEFVVISSGLLLMYGLGAIIGPFLASVAMMVAGSELLYLYTAIVHLVFFGYVLLRLQRRESAPLDQHAAFSDALASVATASQVYEEVAYEEEAAEPDSGTTDAEDDPR
ncbi:MFS transporter [Elongatibacter sediminis]|uniref:MFS transporter n=1 Tax=Elongatibacter sediminis TaxID=3119006 RepID=A0AAW9RP65_9GAMM